VDEDRVLRRPDAVARAEGVGLSALQIGDGGADGVLLREGVNAHVSIVGLDPLR
jgi:hypothetical protein